jgi:hypothetical protein
VIERVLCKRYLRHNVLMFTYLVVPPKRGVQGRGERMPSLLIGLKYAAYRERKEGRLILNE